MAKKVRSEKQMEEYYTAPASAVVFVRRDMSEADIKVAEEKIEAGQSTESVIDEFAEWVSSRG